MEEHTACIQYSSQVVIVYAFCNIDHTHNNSPFIAAPDSLMGGYSIIIAEADLRGHKYHISGFLYHITGGIRQSVRIVLKKEKKYNILQNLSPN